MTYQEALEYKFELPDSFVNRSGFSCFWYIVPNLSEDLAKWLRNFDKNTFNDDTAKEYSTNEEFNLYYRALTL